MDLLNLLLAAVGDEVAREGLGGEQRGPGDFDFSLSAGPFAPIEGLDRDLDDELVGRNVMLAGGVLDAIPLSTGAQE